MPLIAIDGPSGSGKSTLASALARRLGIGRLDTGAMYRAVALAALRGDVALDDSARLIALAKSMDLTVGDEILLDGEDVTEAIRDPAVTLAASVVATDPGVRRELVERQRAWIAEHEGGVVEGRDIGSVVAPDADVKVFLTAELSERGRRRVAEMAVTRGRIDDASVTATMKERDAHDESRVMSPLVVALGAVVIDTTAKSVDVIVDEVLALL